MDVRYKLLLNRFDVIRAAYACAADEIYREAMGERVTRLYRTKYFNTVMEAIELDDNIRKNPPTNLSGVEYNDTSGSNQSVSDCST